VESGSPGKKRHYLILAGIVVLGFVLRAWALTWGLYDSNVSRRPHPDEWPVYWLFHWFGSNHNLDPCPHSQSACFFDWGMVYPYVAYGVRVIMTPFTGLVPAGTFGRQADMEFVWAVIAGRTTSLIFSTLTILVVYQLAAEAFSAEAGLAAALVAALSTLFLQLAHFSTPDSLTTFLLSCTLLLAMRACLQPTARRFALAGALLGLAGGSEYHMTLLALPIGVAWWLGDTPRHARYLALAVGCALITYLVSSIYTLVHLSEFIAATEHTLRIRTVDSSLQYGDRWSVFGPAWLYVIRYPLGYGVGFALTAWMLAGTAWSLIRRTRADWILLAWLIIYFVLVSLSPAKFMRYSAPLLPVLAVFSGRFLIDLLRLTRLYGRITVFALAVAAVLISLVYDGAYAALFSSTDPRLSAAQWIEQRAPAFSEVAFDQLPNGLINLPYYFTAAGYQPCFSLFQPKALSNPARYVVTDSYDREEHPRITQAAVNTFQRALQHNPNYHLVLQVHHVPTFLGASFSIDGSPHDWRYPSHTIAVYEKQPVRSQSGSQTCFRSLAAAHDVLYPAAASGS
jgi:hypothetical protein